MITVFLSHPYGGDPENLAKAKEWFFRLASLGFAPVADWILLCEGWDESRKEEGIKISRELAGSADVLIAIAEDFRSLSEGQQDEWQAGPSKKIIVSESATDVEILQRILSLFEQA